MTGVGSNGCAGPCLDEAASPRLPEISCSRPKNDRVVRGQDGYRASHALQPRPKFGIRCTGVRSEVSEYYTYPDIARREMAALVPRDAQRILDVGCGRGGFGAALRAERPVEVWGIEPNRSAAEVAQSRLDVVLHGRFPDDLPISAQFDCIVFNDVLEHMADPWSALRVSVRFLSSSGVVVASIPNVRHIDVLFDLAVRGDWPYQDQGILDRTHLRFFTVRSAQRLFEESGYVVERTELLNHDVSMRKLPRLLRALRIRNTFTGLQAGFVARPHREVIGTGLIDDRTSSGQPRRR